MARFEELLRATLDVARVFFAPGIVSDPGTVRTLWFFSTLVLAAATFGVAAKASASSAAGSHHARILAATVALLATTTLVGSAAWAEMFVYAAYAAATLQFVEGFLAGRLMQRRPALTAATLLLLIGCSILLSERHVALGAAPLAASGFLILDAAFSYKELTIVTSQLWDNGQHRGITLGIVGSLSCCACVDLPAFATAASVQVAGVELLGYSLGAGVVIGILSAAREDPSRS